MAPEILAPPPSDDDPSVDRDPLIQGDTKLDAPLAEADPGEGGRMKMVIQLVKRCLGVKDIAAMRVSLPASLLEPIPNLEYWQYVDRPDLFAAINDSSDPLERMLAVLRFSFTKELKFVHGKVVKPYNSVLGEHFRAHWTVKPVTYPSDPTEPPIVHHARLTTSSSKSEPTSGYASETPSIKSEKSRKSRKDKDSRLLDDKGLKMDVTADMSSLSLAAKSLASSSSGTEDGSDHVRVIYLTEQVSHHPPISSFYYAVPDRGIEAVGVDQISAKVSGSLSVRVQPGDANQGIFISLTSGPGEGEKYHITHPVAVVTGILRGAPYATITESSIITCTSPNAKQQLRAVIEYKEESWIGRAQFAIEGVIHEYDPSKEDYKAWTRVKQVPSSSVIATFEGSWKKKIQWKRAGESTKHTLIDLSTLGIVSKTVRPLEEQDEFESRKLWDGVTSNLIAKNFAEATKNKQRIEQEQRDRAADRKSKNIEFVPVYFNSDIENGQPTLTEAGRKAVEAEAKAQS